MHNLYGKRRLMPMEIKGTFTLLNGMFCTYGKVNDEGVAVDIYEDSTCKLLVGMEHNLVCNFDPTSEDNVEMLKELIESYSDEFENSMVYYFGESEKQFDLDEMKAKYPVIPKKTGKFAS